MRISKVFLLLGLVFITSGCSRDLVREQGEYLVAYRKDDVGLFIQCRCYGAEMFRVNIEGLADGEYKNDLGGRVKPNDGVNIKDVRVYISDKVYSISAKYVDEGENYYFSAHIKRSRLTSR